METDFKQSMKNAGLVTRDPIIADGRIHRIWVEGDGPGKRNGWYILFGDGIPSGAFGSWKTGVKGTWCAKDTHSLTPEERIEQRRRMDVARKARAAEDDALKSAARQKATQIWQNSAPAPHHHPYLIKKGVKCHGLKLSNDKLVIPLRDGSGTLHSLQFIDGDGNKRFLSGGRKQGCYFSIGQPKSTICIAEGYATGASIYEAVGHAVAIAFDAGNLEAVAKALREKFPDAEIIVCADNDLQTPGNPGLTKARIAAKAIGGLVTFAETLDAKH